MTELSTPACSSAIAAECLSVCGVTFLPVRDGQVCCGCADVLGDEAFDGIAGQAVSGPGGE